MIVKNLLDSEPPSPSVNGISDFQRSPNDIRFAMGTNFAIENFTEEENANPYKSLNAPLLTTRQRQTHRANVGSSTAHIGTVDMKTHSLLSDQKRDTCSPSSVIHTISPDQSENLNNRKISALSNSPVRLNKTRQRVQSFLKKTLYQPSPTSEYAVETSDHVTSVNGKKQILHTANEPKRIQKASPRKLALDDGEPRNTSLLKFKTSQTGSDTYDNRSVGSTSSASTIPSTGSLDSSSLIGIQRPSYNISSDSFVCNPFAHPVTNIITPARSESSAHATEHAPIDDVQQITPKVKLTSLLKVDTSVTLAVLSEEDEEEEDEHNSHFKSTNSYSSKLNTQVQEEEGREVHSDFDEGEIIFDDHSVSHDSVASSDSHVSDASVFDNPFDSNDCKDPFQSFQLSACDTSDEREHLLFEDDNTNDKIESRGTLYKIPSKDLPAEEKNMISRLFHFKKTPVATEYLSGDESSRCSVQQSNDSLEGLNVKGTLELKAKSSQVKSASVVFSENEASLTNGVSSHTLHSKRSKVPKTNSIFLLLLEPRSKVFELIQLQYPIRTTTIDDIIKMYPHISTLDVLNCLEYISE